MTQAITRDDLIKELKGYEARMTRIESALRIAGVVGAGGDASGTLGALVIEKLSENAVRFGVGGLLASHLTSYASLTSNYNADTNLLIDATKPGWQIRLDGPNDRFGIYRAPATVGTPAFVLVGSVNAAGLANFVGGVQSNGVDLLSGKMTSVQANLAHASSGVFPTWAAVTMATGKQLWMFSASGFVGTGGVVAGVKLQHGLNGGALADVVGGNADLAFATANVQQAFPTAFVKTSYAAGTTVTGRITNRVNTATDTNSRVNVSLIELP